MSKIIASVDLRSHFGAIRDQGQRPTCMAFAASDAHAALRLGWEPLSCEYAFYHAQRRAKRPPNMGALLSSMLESIRQDGQPKEDGWPYLPATPTIGATWVPPTAVGPLFGRAGEKAIPTIDQVISELDGGRPVIVLTMLSGSFYSPTDEAVIHPALGEIPEPARRHAVIAIGHGTVDLHRAVLVRNSWGPRWGKDGYGWLTEPFLAPRMFASAILMEEVDVSAHSVAA
jgi:Papain family cysteine protease